MSVRVLPLTLQVVGVQVSNVMGVSPLLALAVKVSNAPLAAVAGGVKLIDWPLRRVLGVNQSVVLLSPSWPNKLFPQHFTAPAVVSAQV